MVKNASLFLFALLVLSYQVNCGSSFLKSNLHTNSYENELEIVKSNAFEAFCFLNVNGTVYDLNSLNMPKEDYQATDGKYTMYYNFCGQSHNQCTQKNTTALAVMTSNADKNVCYSLGGSKATLSKWNFVNDTETNTQSLELVLSEGENCKNDPSKKYQTIYQVVCDEKSNSTRIDDSIAFNSDSCINKIKVYSKAGCPQLNFYSIFLSVVNNKFIFGPILIVLGTFLCFFGNYFFFILCLLTGILAVSFFALFLIFSNISVAFSTAVFWVIIVLVLILGLLFGWFLTKNEWIVDFIIGGFSGYLLALFLYNFFLNRINSNPKVVFWVTIICSIALMILLVWAFKSFVVICGTSFIGAYGIIRGISLMAGGFPDEMQVIDLINRGEWAQVKLLLTNTVYIYLIGFLILFVIGTIVQYKYFNRFNKKDDDKKSKENLGEKDEKKNLLSK